MKKIKREWRKKPKHATTPLPGLNRFTFPVENENASKECLGKESFKKIAQSQAVKDVVGETDGVFRFTSSSDEEENNSGTKSWRTSAGTEVDTSDVFGFASDWRDEENNTEAEDEFPSPEKRRYREAEDEFPSNEKRRYRDNISLEKWEMSSKCYSPESLKRHLGIPKCCSSRIEDSIEDTNSGFNPAKLGKINEGSEHFNSNCEELENEDQQIPLRIDENYVKDRCWEDYVNENIEDREEIEDIEIPVHVSNLSFVKRSDQDGIKNCSKQSENLKLNKNFSSCKGNGSQSQSSLDKFSTTAINGEDIEDDGLNNSNDTRSLMSNNASGCTSKEIAFEEHSQIAKKGSILKVPEKSTVTKKKPKGAKRSKKPNISKRKKKRIRGEIENLEEERIIELENELQSIPVCPLSITKIPFSRSKRLEE